MDDRELLEAIREHAYLEGDFVLRSGRKSRYYLDKYRFETRPDLLGPLGAAIASAVREHEPAAARLAGPELGAVALAASASLAGGLFALGALFRRGSAGRRERVDLYYDDGSMVSLGDGSPESGRLLELARETLRTART